MPAQTPEAAALRAELEAAVIAAAERIGVGGLAKAEVVKPFVNRGVHLATLYRWFDAIMASGKPGQRLAKRVKRAAGRRVAKSADDPAAAAAEVRAELAEALPTVVKVDEVLGGAAGGRVVGVIERLQAVMTDIEMLIRHAKTEDGKVRNARLLGTSLEQMRRCLETGVRLHQAMRDAAAVDALQDAIVDEIGKCDAALRERVLLRLQDVAVAWGG
jgi:hypothetical protein